MPGSLKKLEEVTLSGATASVTLGDDTWDTSYNVYYVTFDGVKVSADDSLAFRVLASGTPQIGTGYQESTLYAKSDTNSTIGGVVGLGQSDATATIDSGVAASSGNGHMYLFSFNNSAEYSYMTVDSVHMQYNTNSGRGFHKSIIHTVAAANDGLIFKCNTDSNNLTAGTFKLFGISK